MAGHLAAVALMVPNLPAGEIRAAIDAGDWLRAAELLAVHQRDLAAALATVDRASFVREPWLDLLLAQRALLGELHNERSKVAAALAQLGNDHRGARAWLKELA